MSNPALNEAVSWTAQLMDAEWKGRRDRENLVRYRLAKRLGVSESYLFRLQYKKHEMSDVKGSVYRALMLGAKLYGIVTDAGERAYLQEKELAHARHSKLVGLTDFVAGTQDERSVK